MFNLYTTETLSPPNSYTAIIDRSSSIKSNCGHPVSSDPPRHNLFQQLHAARYA